jgi:outer membrane protein TolC
MPNARLLLTAALAAVLGGCSLAPPYSPPATPIAAAYKEQGPWTPAAPADAQPRGQWWAMFSDPVLDDLEARAEKANPTLAAAVAAYDQARALAAQARAGLVPEIDGAGLSTRQRRSDNQPLRVGGPNQYTTTQLGVSVAYEIDCAIPPAAPAGGRRRARRTCARRGSACRPTSRTTTSPCAAWTRSFAC